MSEEKKKEKKTSSSGPEQAASAKPRGGAEAGAKVPHAPSKKSPGTLRIRQVKSGICAPVDQKQTLFGLGLRRIRQEVVRPDTPALRGQIHKVRHLVEIVEGA
jgi:large subunit ribosomal protein L30